MTHSRRPRRESAAWAATLVACAVPGAASAAAAPADAPPAIATPVCRAFERPGANLDAATHARPDGAVWYADRSGNRIVRLGPDRARTPFVPTDAATVRLAGLAFGPDGNVWYVKDTANRVGRIAPTGRGAREFTLPEANSLPTGLVADRSGRLWFASGVRGYLGAVAVDGAVVVHRGPNAMGRDFAPHALAFGVDGNLWATDRGQNAIYRFDVGSGTFTRFDIPTANAHPDAITAGRDAMWFTMSAVRRIGRIAPGGTITEYALGALDGGAPRGIVATADGTLWVTTTGRFAVRVLPDGAVRPFECGRALGTAIVGPAGAPWFFDNGRIWVVEDAAAPRAPRLSADAGDRR